MTKTVILIGAPGAGKTTVGQALAERLGIPFYDVDAEVVSTTGREISDIFAVDGEAAFRAIEQELTLSLIERPGVVSLGGGAPMTPAIAEAITGRAVVWLRISAPDAARRIGLDQSRPLLAGSGSVPGIRAMLIRMLAERAPIYESCARWVVDTTGSTPDQVVAAIEEVLS